MDTAHQNPFGIPSPLKDLNIVIGSATAHPEQPELDLTARAFPSRYPIYVGQVGIAVARNHKFDTDLLSRPLCAESLCAGDRIDTNDRITSVREDGAIGMHGDVAGHIGLALLSVQDVSLPGNSIELHNRIPLHCNQATLEIRQDRVRTTQVRSPRRGPVAGDGLDGAVAWNANTSATPLGLGTAGTIVVTDRCRNRPQHRTQGQGAGIVRIAGRNRDIGRGRPGRDRHVPHGERGQQRRIALDRLTTVGSLEPRSDRLPAVRTHSTPRRVRASPTIMVSRLGERVTAPPPPDGGLPDGGTV